MKKPAYTAIPDARDRNYWQLKVNRPGERLRIFVPIDQELHRALLTKAREARPIAKQRDLNYKLSPTGTLAVPKSD